jgi:hypothetical protein
MQGIIILEVPGQIEEEPGYHIAVKAFFDPLDNA